eukprot:SAG25_NODE_689_length_5921_cov_14.049296_8_plen_165_part_00
MAAAGGILRSCMEICGVVAGLRPEARRPVQGQGRGLRGTSRKHQTTCVACTQWEHQRQWGGDLCCVPGTCVLHPVLDCAKRPRRSYAAMPGGKILNPMATPLTDREDRLSPPTREREESGVARELQKQRTADIVISYYWALMNIMTVDSNGTRCSLHTVILSGF